MVPDGWELSTFDKHIDLLSGFAFKSSGYTDDKGDISLLRGDNIAPGSLRWTGVKKWPKEKYQSLEKYHLQVHDLVIAMDRTWVSSGLKVAEVKKSDLPCLLVQRVSRIRALPSLEQSLLKQYFSNYRFEQYVKSVQTETAVPHISASQIKGFSFLLPPLIEQQKIAQILSTWDKAISTAENLVDVSKQQRKALIQQLLTGKKRLVRDGERVECEGDWRKSRTPYKEIPLDWNELSLEEISSFITKGATPTTYGFEWQESGIPFLRSECVGEDGFKSSGLSFICQDAHEAMARSKVFSGDLLITITGNVGRVCRLPVEYPEANINQHIAKITLNSSDVSSDFIYHCLRDSKYRIHFERITTGQAYPQISLVQVRDVMVPIPSLLEQQKIAQVLTAADKEIELLEAKLAHFKQEKKALMQQLLTGKRRVKIEPELDSDLETAC